MAEIVIEGMGDVIGVQSSDILRAHVRDQIRCKRKSVSSVG